MAALYNQAMDIIYADSLFFLNLIIDYLLLLATAKICVLPLKRVRMAFSAAVGGAYALAAVLCPSFFALPTVKLFMGTALCTIAFGVKEKLIRTVGTFFAVSAAFGGAVYAASTLGGYPRSGKSFIPVSGKVLFLSFAVSYAVLNVLFRRADNKVQRQLRQIEITLGEKSVSLTALTDTGNELSDPVSGEKVMVCQAVALYPLLSDKAELLLADPIDSFEALTALPELKGRLRLLPCSCVVAQSSLLLCFRPDSLKIDGKKSRASIAISQNRLSPDGEFQALW